VIWLDSATPNSTNDLEFLKSHGAEVRLFDFKKEVKGTPFEGKFNKIQVKWSGHETWPAERTAADLARYLILFKHGGLWFDSDVMFLRDMSSLLPYEFAYPWSKRGVQGLPENHTLNAAMIRLFQNSPANQDMISRVVKENLPFGLWGLSSLRDNTRHPDLNVVDTEVFDALWKDNNFFNSAQQAQLINSERSRETKRFKWFFSSDTNLLEAGLSVLSSSNSFVYHWHNNWDAYMKPGAAASLYETFFDCVLIGSCAKAAGSLSMPL
jgi:hypothetical protein